MIDVVLIPDLLLAIVAATFLALVLALYITGRVSSLSCSLARNSTQRVGALGFRVILRPFLCLLKVPLPVGAIVFSRLSDNVLSVLSVVFATVSTLLLFSLRPSFAIALAIEFHICGTMCALLGKYSFPILFVELSSLGAYALLVIVSALPVEPELAIFVGFVPFPLLQSVTLSINATILLVTFLAASRKQRGFSSGSTEVFRRGGLGFATCCTCFGWCVVGGILMLHKKLTFLVPRPRMLAHRWDISITPVIIP